MSNARDTETSPLTPEQKQRAEALRIAASILSDRGPFTAGSLPGSRTTDDAIALADFILTGLHPAEFVDDAPEPEAGDASATVKVTECQWPGCHERAAALADEPPSAMLVRRRGDGEWSPYPACVRHDIRMLHEG